MARSKHPVPMDNRKTIAVDIDDVLADNAAGFVAFSNRRWGTNLTVDDYHEHWGDLWQVDLEETRRRSDELHASGAIGDYKNNEPALQVLRELRNIYRLVIVTSRRRIIETETLAWITKHYTDLFEEIHFAGFWDTLTDHSITMTKADICRQIGADYLIDDQLKHVQAAAAAGLRGILFGNYAWNAADTLPEHVVRCADWDAVRRFFEQEQIRAAR